MKREEEERQREAERQRLDWEYTRKVSKDVRLDLSKEIRRKGGDNAGQGIATSAIYREMGGSPEPKGNRDGWSAKDLKRTAINEHLAQQKIKELLGKQKAQDPEAQKELNRRIADKAAEGARAGEALQNDPDSPGRTEGWFSWLWGDPDEPEVKQSEQLESEQLELPVNPAPDPDREWTLGDLGRLIFLGGRDEKLTDQ